MHPEHRPNGTVPNGYGATISPPHPNDGGFHAPPPPTGQPYGQPVPYAAPSPYMGPYNGPPGQQVRRKQVRATQACNHCRARKQKCDEARPCQFCRENNFDCQYKDVPPPKQDRSMMQLQDSVNGISDVLKDFIGEVNAWRQSVESRLPPARAIENVGSPDATFAMPQRDPNSSRLPTPLQGRHAHRRIDGMKIESPTVPPSHMSPINNQASTPIKQESMYGPPQQPATPADSVRTDQSRNTEARTKERVGLQSDHTTAAHKLLEEWTLMAHFPEGIEYLQRLKESGRDISEYPMQVEQARGLLRVWGVGEGQDLNDGAQGPGSPESSNESDAPSPAQGKDGLWGHPPGDQPSPSTMSTSTPRDDFGYEGGLGSDGRPNFRASVIRNLHQSYLDTMHTFHPFLNPSKLARMVKEFIDQYSPDAKGANPMSPANHQLNPGIKRKRSSSAFGEPYSSRGAIERSLRNAIVLLVLALGKVCGYTDKLPHPQSDKGSTTSGSAWGQMNGSFTSDVSDDARPRNIDVLPGMAYFAYATDILGNQAGGHTVAHAQANILAGLYLSQFARVLESWSWINSACRITAVLIKTDYDKLVRKFYFSREAERVLSAKERYRLDLVLCAYWTCVQLESDILAEMSTLPASSLTEHQNDIMYPAGVFEKLPIEENDKAIMEYMKPRKAPDDDSIMKFYSSHIWMRVILNGAHNALYGASGHRSFDATNVKEVASHATSYLDILESWRRVLPSELAWKDEDPPPTDLNVARVRAKYYGALYMMLRPYLRIASHGIDYPPSHYSGSWSHHNSPAAGGDSATTTNRNVNMVDLSDDQRKLIEVASRCIDSAVRSTIAFDRVGAEPDSPYENFKSTRTKRLVLTNIFGTLHAQFGNMLVLAAVLKSKLYPHLPSNTKLTPRNLNALFERTIHVLEETAPNSPILKVDLDILRNVRRQLNLPSYQH